MTKKELFRAYMTEPVLAGFGLSLMLNIFGRDANANFMHEEARDILSLAVVLLGAALALWIGLFWISSTEFGQWLAKRDMLEATDKAYVASGLALLSTCICCIFCAHIAATRLICQLTGEYICLCGLMTMISLLSNTRHLLRLHGLFTRQKSSVQEMRIAG